MTTNVERLREQLRGASQQAIRRDHPDFERIYREAVGQGAARDDFQRAASAVANVDTPQFARWRQLLLAIFDLELAITRLETARDLLQVLPGEAVCTDLRVTRGRWADYTYGAWLFAAQAALERAERLATRASRSLIKPHPSPEAVVDPASLSRHLKDHLDSIKKLRNPQAHGGGTVDSFADRRRLDELAVLGVWPPIEDILEHFPSTTHPLQAQMAHEMTLQYFAAIDATAGLILSSVDWAVVQ